MIEICATFLKEILRKNFARLIYPTCSGDWYKRKGYNGTSDQERFNDFIAKQKLPDSIYYEEFQSLELTRKFIDSNGYQIDSVEIKPTKLLSKNKPGEGLYIICFLGKSEYYESRFRDMALFARNTGATIIGFNPKGFNTSTGKTKILFDIVDDGIALIEYLLARNITPKQIVLYGNSLGGAVQELVCKHFRKLKLIDFRQINSNSFCSLAAVLSTNINMPFLESKLMQLMKYSGWEMNYEQSFYKTGVYRCFLVRKGDQVIKTEALFCYRINRSQDIIDAPNEYREILSWLNENSELIPITLSEKDPHELSLNSMCLGIKDRKGCNFTVWYFINQYLEASNKFV
ncbi:MAG: alpha/beta hydrolase family protein [Rickettsiaceae bacterium]